jgi:hypothetical protein
VGEEAVEREVKAEEIQMKQLVRQGMKRALSVFPSSNPGIFAKTESRWRAGWRRIEGSR